MCLIMLSFTTFVNLECLPFSCSYFNLYIKKELYLFRNTNDILKFQSCLFSRTSLNGSETFLTYSYIICTMKIVQELQFLLTQSY